VVKSVARGPIVVRGEDSESVTAPTDRGGTDRTVAPPARRAGLVALDARPADAAPLAWRIAGSAWLGRSRQATVHVDDARVSRRHASIEPRHDGLFLRDEGSSHGTFVNATRIPDGGIVARFGEVVRVGDVLLLVVADVERSASRPRRSEGSASGFADTLIAGPELAAVWDEARRAAGLREPVLVTGETGSGKECVARMLHGEREPRGPFVAVNVSAVPDPLFEAELFGYERGAFTGAETGRLGAFREACDGVLFLDEVGELKLENQCKLLRALDTGQVRPLGSKGEVAVRARVVSATNRDLEQACDSGDFRSDLYYRLSGLVIHVPPLRERRGDILLIARDVLNQRSPELVLSTDAAESLALARWEGNVRQLRHAVYQAVDRALHAGERVVRLEHLSSLARVEPGAQELTSDRIAQALVQCGGVASHAARRLGVSRTTLYKALKRLRQEQPEVAVSATEGAPGAAGLAEDR
jgi:DNA-binding NtrC family response regulator